MNTFVKVIALLPWIDWVAVIVFFGAWSGYAWFAPTVR